MVHHAEASRLNIERMKQIYQQLSCYRGLGLLATVPSNTGNSNGETGFPVESAHNASSPSGYQMPGHSQGDWQSGVMMYLQGDQQTSISTHQQGYAGTSASVMCYGQGTQQIPGPAIQKGPEHHCTPQTSGKRHSEDSGNSRGSKVQRQSTH